MIKIIILTLLVSLAFVNVNSQELTKDKKPLFVAFASASAQLPGGDLKERFGLNSSVGLGVLYKTKNNFLFGASWDYKFGNALKSTAYGILDSLRTESGEIINRNGEYANIVLTERGFYADIKFGKIFSSSTISNNKSSGLMVLFGAGMLQHRIRIDNEGNNVPGIINDYKKGYDRLTNGYAISEFVGYIYISENKLFNAFAGFEFTQAFTQSRRDFDYDLRSQDTQKRIDLLHSIKVGFIIPISKRSPEEFYYY